MMLHLARWSLLLLATTLLQVQSQATAKGPTSPVACSSSRIQQLQLCTNVTALCGYVVLCEGGEERVLCDSNWTPADATVACEQFTNFDSGVPRPDLLSNTNLDIPTSTFAPRCSGTEQNLAECHNETSSSTATCQPQQFAAGVICFNSTPTSSAIPDPTTITIDIAPTSTESTATPTQPPQSSQPQTETVDPPTSSSFTSRPPGADPTPTSAVSTDTESNSDSLTVVIYLVAGIAVLIFIAIIVLVVLICSIKALHRSRVKDAEPASPTAEKTVLNNQLDRAVPEPVYAEPEPEPKPAESPGPIRASNPSFQYHIYQEVGPGTWNRTAHGTAQAVQTENVPQLKDGPVLEVQQLEASYNSSGYFSLENGRQYATLEPFTASGSASHSQEDFSNSTNSSALLKRSMKSSTLPQAASDRSPAGSETAEYITEQVQEGCVELTEVPKLQTFCGSEGQEGDYATLNPNGVQYATLEPYIKKETHSLSASPNEDNTYSQLNRFPTMPAATAAAAVVRCHTDNNEHMLMPQGKVLMTEC